MKTNDDILNSLRPAFEKRNEFLKLGIDPQQATDMSFGPQDLQALEQAKHNEALRIAFLCGMQHKEKQLYGMAELTDQQAMDRTIQVINEMLY